MLLVYGTNATKICYSTYVLCSLCAINKAGILPFFMIRKICNDFESKIKFALGMDESDVGASLIAFVKTGILTKSVWLFFCTFWLKQ